MGINIGSAQVQANNLSQYANELMIIKNDLSRYQTIINANWKAEEMIKFNIGMAKVLENICECNRIANSLSSDIISVANEIKREEDAEAARRRSALAATMKAKK